MPKSFYRLSVRYALSLVLASAASLSQAGTFGVAPLRLELNGKVRTAVVTVHNEGAEPLQLDVNPVSWTMDEAGTEHYSPTDDLAVFPPGLTIPAGQKRVIRIGIASNPDAGEKSYRVFLKEIQAEVSNAMKARSGQVSMLVNFGVPVFVSPSGTKPSVQGTATASKGLVQLQLQNSGNGRARVEGLQLGSTAKDYSSPYILAGGTRTLSFKVTPADCALARQQTVEVLLHDDSTVTLPVDLSSACQ